MSEDPCPSLLASGTTHRATSFAAAIDIIEAGAALEDAVAAATQAEMQAALTRTGTWLRAAATHYDQVGDARLAQRAACAAAVAEAWAAIPVSPAAGSLQTSLVQFQQETLVPLHGVLRRLSDDAAAQGARDSVELFWAPVLLGVSVLAADWLAQLQGRPLERRRRAGR